MWEEGELTFVVFDLRHDSAFAGGVRDVIPQAVFVLHVSSGELLRAEVVEMDQATGNPRARSISEL